MCESGNICGLCDNTKKTEQSEGQVERVVMSDLLERLEDAHRNSQQRVLGSNIFLEAASEIKQLRFELLMVAKVASEKPLFFNPLNAAHAKKIRDKVLENADKYVGS